MTNQRIGDVIASIVMQEKRAWDLTKPGSPQRKAMIDKYEQTVGLDVKPGKDVEWCSSMLSWAIKEADSRFPASPNVKNMLRGRPYPEMPPEFGGINLSAGHTDRRNDESTLDFLNRINPKPGDPIEFGRPGLGMQQAKDAKFGHVGIITHVTRDSADRVTSITVIGGNETPTGRTPGWQRREGTIRTSTYPNPNSSLAIIGHVDIEQAAKSHHIPVEPVQLAEKHDFSTIKGLPSLASTGVSLAEAAPHHSDNGKLPTLAGVTVSDTTQHPTSGAPLTNLATRTETLPRDRR